MSLLFNVCNHIDSPPVSNVAKFCRLTAKIDLSQSSAPPTNQRPDARKKKKMLHLPTSTPTSSARSSQLADTMLPTPTPTRPLGMSDKMQQTNTDTPKLAPPPQHTFVYPPRPPAFSSPVSSQSPRGLFLPKSAPIPILQPLQLPQIRPATSPLPRPSPSFHTPAIIYQTSQSQIRAGDGKTHNRR